MVQLMMDYGIGVATTNTYPLQKIDADYFAEEWQDAIMPVVQGMLDASKRLCP